MYLFIFACAGSSLLRGLSLVVSRGRSRCSAHTSHFSGSSCCGALAVGSGPVIVVVHGLSSSMPGDLQGLGIEPMSPALAGGFLITGPPGKS